MNALIGEHRAAVSDVPTTVRVDAYQWREYTIYDTPGINAPKRDEEISKEHLAKCDVIIFVLDTAGAFNLGKNYQELVDIARSGKRLLMVLNNKSIDCDLQTDEGRLAIAKIREHIYEDFSSKYREDGTRISANELAKKYKVIVVNARDAIDARTNDQLPAEARQQLLEISNIGELEDAIVDEYGRTNGYTILRQIAEKIKGAMGNLSNRIGILQRDENMESVVKALEDVREIQELTLQKLGDYAREEAQNLDDGISAILLGASNEADVQKKIGDLVKPFEELIKERIKKVIETSASRVNACVENFQLQMDRIKCETLPPVILEIVEKEPVNSKTCFPPKNRSLGAEDIVLAQQGVKIALPLIKKIPMIGRFIYKIPYLGPVLIGLFLLNKLFGSDGSEKQVDAQVERSRQAAEMERRRNEAEALRRSEAKEQAVRIRKRIAAAAIDGIDEAVRNSFRETIEGMESAITSQRVGMKEVIKDLAEAEQLKQSLIQSVEGFCNG
jgi:hypothetical protein